MIIGVTGYGSTGASAFVDLLKEFEDVQSLNEAMEFRLIDQPDGIQDLKYQLCYSRRRLNSNIALKRFKKDIKCQRNRWINRACKRKFKELTEQYFSSITEIVWKGKSAFDPLDIQNPFEYTIVNKLIRRIIHKAGLKVMWPLPQNRYFSFIDESEFNRLTSIYLHSILLECGFDLSKPIILEQTFQSSHPSEGMEYFDDCRALIINRDPRDLYLATNFIFPQYCSFMPNMGNVDEFILYYKRLVAPREADNRIRYYNFEELIYDYDRVCQELSDWVGLKHMKKGERFKTEFSINNTQIYKKFPEHAKDINKIENELGEYLFPFEKYSKDLKIQKVNTGFFMKPRDITIRRHSDE